MRVVAAMVHLCVVALGLRAQAAPLDAVLLPSAPLAADGERAHLLRLYLVEHDALLPGVPSVHAAHGAIVGAPTPTSDGGIALRYRPPRATAPASDTLTVSLHGRERVLTVALEPARRIKLALEAPPSAFL